MQQCLRPRAAHAAQAARRQSHLRARQLAQRSRHVAYSATGAANTDLRQASYLLDSCLSPFRTETWAGRVP